VERRVSDSWPVTTADTPSSQATRSRNYFSFAKQSNNEALVQRLTPTKACSSRSSRAFPRRSCRFEPSQVPFRPPSKHSNCVSGSCCAVNQQGVLPSAASRRTPFSCASSASSGESGAMYVSAFGTTTCSTRSFAWFARAMLIAQREAASELEEKSVKWRILVSTRPSLLCPVTQVKVATLRDPRDRSA
jgi:hypothetical protein